jgi:CheY-like chemotaxis protein
VVRVLAELHGGSVELRSPGEGKGTEAILRLPIAASMPAAQGEAVAASPALPQGHRTVLVIEDNADVAEMLAVFLSQLGHRVMVASDGRTGLEAALRNRPDVVVCDIGLPGLNGFEIASRLRADAAFAHCLLIALTGYGDVSDRRRSHEAGFAYHLTKPADPMQVAQLIAGADARH